MKAYTFLLIFQMRHRYISCTKNSIKCIVRDDEENWVGNCSFNFIKAVLILVEQSKIVFERDFEKGVENLKIKYKSSIRYYFIFKLVFDLILKLFQKELGDQLELLNFLNSQNTRIEFAKILDDNISSFKIQRYLKFGCTIDILSEKIDVILKNYTFHGLKINILTCNIIYEAIKDGSEEIKLIIGKIVRSRTSYYADFITYRYGLREDRRRELDNFREEIIHKLDFFTPCTFQKCTEVILDYKRNLPSLERIYIFYIFDVNLYFLSTFETFLKKQIDFSWVEFQNVIMDDLGNLVIDMDIFIKFKSDIQSMGISLYTFYNIFNDELELRMLFEFCFKALKCEIDLIILNRSYRVIVYMFKMFFGSFNKSISDFKDDINRMRLFLELEYTRNDNMADQALLGKSTTTKYKKLKI